MTGAKGGVGRGEVVVVVVVGGWMEDRVGRDEGKFNNEVRSKEEEDREEEVVVA